jgi:molybdopterin-containing oxidoreductase family membrane subunit
MAKVMLLTGLIVAYGYACEAFIAWYGGNQYEGFMMLNRLFGPYRYQYWALITCNVILPQVLWFKSVRMNVPLLFLFLRYLPMISIFEMRTMLPEAKVEE